MSNCGHSRAQSGRLKAEGTKGMSGKLICQGQSLLGIRPLGPLCRGAIVETAHKVAFRQRAVMSNEQ